MGTKWKQNTRNSILKGKGFYISYNPMCNLPLQTDSKERKPDETALVVRKRFYILYGDWRKDYEKLVPKGYQACKKFFDQHGKYRSFWTN